jgi:hypothetical protein
MKRKKEKKGKEQTRKEKQTDEKRKIRPHFTC